MNIVFRVDSSAQMGSGHLKRCLTLANGLRREGVNISFVSRLHSGHLIGKLEAEGYLVHKLSAPVDAKACLNTANMWLGVSVEQDLNETLSVLDGQQYDWLVVDHYGLDKTWESAVRINANKIMVIDDLANRAHDCDLLLDQNYFGTETESRYVDYIDSSADCLLGPKFALLGPEYVSLRAISVPSDGLVRRVLVFLGNSDLSNQTAQILAALSRPELSHLLVDLVVGSNHPNPEALKQLVLDRPGIVFHDELSTLAGLMMKNDLVIGAGGATTWERMCLGKPAIAICVAENQRMFSQQLFVDGYQKLLAVEKGSSENAWYEAILQLIDEPAYVKKMAHRAAELVDGLGADRVVQHILSSSTQLDSEHIIPAQALKCINLLTDENTWSLGIIKQLQQGWLEQGFQVNLTYRPDELPPGDVCFILGCSKILKPEHLALNNYNLVVHASALPEGRGWSPMTWQILEGENKICMTLFEAMPELDSGPIYAQEWIALDGTELVNEWREKQEKVTQGLCRRWVDTYPESTYDPIPQHGEGSFYARRRVKDSELDPDKTLREQFNLLRVVDNKHYPAFFELNDKRYQILIEPME